MLHACTVEFALVADYLYCVSLGFLFRPNEYLFLDIGQGQLLDRYHLYYETAAGAK
jgi:hypothetical protein